MSTVKSAKVILCVATLWSPLKKPGEEAGELLVGAPGGELAIGGVGVVGVAVSADGPGEVGPAGAGDEEAEEEAPEGDGVEGEAPAPLQPFLSVVLSMILALVFEGYLSK